MAKCKNVESLASGCTDSEFCYILSLGWLEREYGNAHLARVRGHVECLVCLGCPLAKDRTSTNISLMVLTQSALRVLGNLNGG